MTGYILFQVRYVSGKILGKNVSTLPSTWEFFLDNRPHCHKLEGVPASFKRFILMGNLMENLVLYGARSSYIVVIEKGVHDSLTVV